MRTRAKDIFIKISGFLSLDSILKVIRAKDESVSAAVALKPARKNSSAALFLLEQPTEMEKYGEN
jgi:hypothetical protein